MSKLTIKNNPVQEASEPAAFGKAYQDFVGRCWRDTPDGNKKPNYSERAINFMLDCAHIANGTAVKGLPQQGFALKKANISDLVGDCLHLQYSKDDGRKGVDVWLNPHSQKALVDLYGFNPERPYDSTHKEFDARNNTAEDFADFIVNVMPTYKGESKTAESRKLTIRVHEDKKSEAADEQVEHGEECHLFIEDDPNYQVSFRSDNGHVYTFYVRADNPQDALDSAYHEFGVNYNMSIKGEAHYEDDIPQGVEAVEVGTKYAPKVNVAVDPWDGKGVRVLYIPEIYLSKIVNGDSSGMEDEDIAECDKFVDRYVKKGYDMVSVFPVCGPQGEWWDQNYQGDVLCSTTVD